MTDSTNPHPLADTKVAATGRLASMTHSSLAELVDEMGGRFVQLPSRGSCTLIVGQEGWPLDEQARPTAALAQARRLKALGYPIQIVTEEVFFDQLGLVDHTASIHRRYTIVQLSRLLEVSCATIRAWLRAGLIEPIETVHRLAFFDYHQVTSAKMLSELVSSGLSVQQIRTGLDGLRRWLPGLDEPMAQLAVLEDDARLLVRLQNGQLAEPTGQLQMDFEQGEEPLAVAGGLDDQSVEQWVHQAVEYEDAGEFSAAADAYGRAARLAPDDPVLFFHLANCLYAGGATDEAITQFRRAVEIDSQYAEAWSNLGLLLAEIDSPDDAIEALRRAITIVPQYADAHFQLADVLAASGHSADACEHWEAYLALDPTSPWAVDARRRLADAGATSETIRLAGDP